MKYRAEITGLRAFAVMPVILFHAGLHVMGGGFVGVDIFFVLSGYLITSIILRDIEDGQFSLKRFYQRRARRILPALYLMLAVTLPLAAVFMVPQQLEAYARSLAATVLFISNVHFWDSVGYFALDAEQMPLLHTWSLAVEEQFYFLFPLILLGLARFGRRAVLIGALVMFILSFLLNEWGWRNEPEVNFFFTFSRFWELLAGSLCAVVLMDRAPWRGNVLSAIGLAMLLIVIALPPVLPWPSMPVWAGVLGTVLIVLFAGQGTWVARFLSWGPFVWIGLVSYSAYLWHQPMFAFARLIPVLQPSPFVMGALAVGAVLMGWLSYRFIEEPIRRRRLPWFEAGMRPVLALAVVSFALCGAGFAVYGAKGLPDRLDARAQAWAADAEPSDNRRQCLFDKDKGLDGHPYKRCIQGPEGQAPRVMILGDSHANAISPAIQEALSQRGIASYAVAYSGCVALPEMFRVDKPDNHRCMEFNRNALEYAREAGIDTLVLSSRFTLYWNGHRFVNGEGGYEPGPPQFIDTADHLNDRGRLNDEARRDRVIAAYVDRLNALAQEFRIVLVGPIPEAGWNVPDTLVKMSLRELDDGQTNLTTSAAQYDARNGRIVELFRGLVSDRLTLVEPRDVYCDTAVQGRCLNDLDGESLYVDDDHLSFAGAQLLAGPVADAVQQALR
ncbi:acyltransferase family protein [Donghicola mangrovi]|uniref:Acyltransferase n=1 Tax=Donghicola mangrovi TaxID=2729614 RepID=A0A850Q3C0_9RHOB|nr:acyltransferase family protein [Donghicola mangrovi]NVO23596.1 acyltransferase [Donghicola mangrovi]